MTMDGAWMLHQMFRFRRDLWNPLPTAEKQLLVAPLVDLLVASEAQKQYQTAAFAMLGHKADFLLLHFRESVDRLQAVQNLIANLPLSAFLEPTDSYVSVVELGLYESSVKTYQGLLDAGTEPHSPEWQGSIHAAIEKNKEMMKSRLHPAVPDLAYLCFYPMNRRRGEHKNWYSVPIQERARMMLEHGTVGRRYAEEVRQIISGSIGYDDWEWAVTLFSNDPHQFKKLIYEMRFDEVSAVYAEFGRFLTGVRCKAANFPALAGI